MHMAMQPAMCHLLNCPLLVALVSRSAYNKYISKKRWEVPLKTKKVVTPPAFFFLKKSKKIRGTITPKVYFRPLTGDPGGSSLVSYDTFCISPC